MAYPEIKMKSVALKTWETFKSFFVQTEKQEQMNVPTHEAMQEKCLHIYLENYNRVLRNCELSQLTITQVADEVFHIFHQLHSPLVHHHKTGFVWRANSLSEVHFVCVCVPTMHC